MRDAGVNEMTHNRQALAATRVVWILDNDIKQLLLGSMSWVRKAP
jgi:hypothetical protein